jgi:hypothetical protein
MNKRKRVAIKKHSRKLKKLKDKRKATTPPSGGRAGAHR